MDPVSPVQLPNDPQDAKPKVAMRLALRLALLYLGFAVTWIVVSDRAVEALVPADVRRLSNFQTAKGLFFIAMTAALLFFVVRHFIKSLQETQSQMQVRLERVAAQYMQLFEHSPVAMMIFDPATQRILAANDVCSVVLGYSRVELLNMSMLALLAQEEQARALVLARSQLPEFSRQQWQHRRRDGRIIHVDTISRPIDFNGRPVRIQLLMDVTERLQTERSLAQYRTQLEQRVAERTNELSQTNRLLREEVQERQNMEEQLRAATAAAEAANDAKSTFLANTSHEIRTPLTSILGYADLLADEGLDSENRTKYLDVVRHNAQHLLALIDDLLDLSRAEMGKVRVTFDENVPQEIAQQAIELLRPRAAEKHLSLVLEIGPDVPQRVTTDGVRLRQILLNLLSNAVKFTQAGSVNLRLAASSVDGTEMLHFEVRDTGIGMDKEHLERVFEPFYQVEHRNTRRFGGFGLGLAISRQLAAQMGGVLAVNSTPGAGSTFTLSLPVQPLTGMVPPPYIVPGTGKSAKAGPGSLDGHILLAEDTPNIRRLVEEYLLRAGAKVTSVEDGAQAVARVKASLEPGAGESTIDLVLLDIHMPVLDGMGALRQIRELGYAGPIVGLSADYAEKSVAEWISEGWDSMAAKPIDRQAFIPLLASMLTGRKAARQGAAVAQE